MFTVCQVRASRDYVSDWWFHSEFYLLMNSYKISLESYYEIAYFCPLISKPNRKQSILYCFEVFADHNNI